MGHSPMQLILPPSPLHPSFIMLSKSRPPLLGQMRGEVELAMASPTLKEFKVPWERGVGTYPTWMLSGAQELG